MLLPEHQVRFEAVKKALIGTQFFVSDKSTATSICFLLYQRGESKPRLIKKNKSLEALIKAIKKFAHVKEEDISKQTTPVQKETSVVEPRKYWWQDQD